ncbi:MAG: DNA cytosine methyltransferase [Ignavibacteriales bacterium]|nr:MAG: DNA cytosine methyltransferase [Ignavibacteriales bacterium]
MTLKILNLYAGIGGNRKLWNGDIEVTAIENVPEIAKIYQDFFPNDKVIVADAHQYLLEHYKEFDFIWSSPPCPTHSRMRKTISMGIGAKAVYPDMKLYEEILFLEGYFEGKWVVENVISWYNPLIKPYELERHYFWSNFVLTNIKVTDCKIQLQNGSHNIKESDSEQVIKLQKELGFNLEKYNLSTMDARTMLRNCVNPKTAIHIFNMAFKEKQEVLI